MESKLVSIITPSYNSSIYIAEAIESVLLQTYQNWEMIIIDDKSPDKTNEIIKFYMKTDKRIKLIKLKRNIGSANARNKGIKKAKGKYIAFLDSDDKWLPEKLEKQVNFMNTNNLTITCSSYYTIDKFGKKINIRNSKEIFSYKDMLKTNQVGNLTGIYDCEKLGKVFMDDIGHEDYTLWLKIMKIVCKTKSINEPLAEYRILNNSLSSNKFKTLKWQWHIYRRIVNLNVFDSSYYFCWYIYNALKKRI